MTAGRKGVGQQKKWRGEEGRWGKVPAIPLELLLLFMRNLPIYTNSFGLIGLKRKEQRKPFACLGQLAVIAIAFAPFSLLPSPCHLAWVSVNGYSYGFTSARHPWTCHGHGQDIMFAPHIFCLPFARIYINRAPSRWLSFPCPPSPDLLFHWGCHGCQLSIVFAHRQRICRDVQLAALEIGLERAWWISRNFKDANFCRGALTWRCCEHSTQCHKKKVKQCRRAWKQLKESFLNQLGKSLINLSIIKVAAINCNWKLFHFHSWLKFKLWHFIWCQFDASVLESSIVYIFFFLETRKIYFYNLSLSALKVLHFFWLHLFSWFICQVRQT